MNGGHAPRDDTAHTPPSSLALRNENLRLATINADLLAALRFLHDDIQGRQDDGANFNPGTLNALDVARAAIQKATT